MKKILFFFIVFLSNSYFSQNKNTEYIQLCHSNANLSGGDKLLITLIPTQKNRKKPISVKIYSRGVYYDSKRISLEEYQKIYNKVLEMSQKDIELPTDTTINNSEINTICMKNDTLKRNFHTIGMIRQYHGKFYEMAEQILKAAKMKIKDLN